MFLIIPRCYIHLDGLVTLECLHFARFTLCIVGLSFCTVLRKFQFNLAHLRHHHFTLLEAARRETAVLVTTSAIFEDKKTMKKKRRQYSWQLATTVLLLSSPSDISETAKSFTGCRLHISSYYCLCGANQTKGPHCLLPHKQFKIFIMFIPQQYCDRQISLPQKQELQT